MGVRNSTPGAKGEGMTKHPDLSDLARDGAEIAVRVTPKAGRNEIRRDGDRIAVRVTAVPEDGKANAAVQALLARALGVAKTRLVLVRGQAARDKVFRLDQDLSPRGRRR